MLHGVAESRATIIECVQGADLLEPARESIALRSLARGEHVVSVGALASVTALGTSPGVVHGDARLIERIRALRRHSGAEFPGGMQRAWAYFIGLGHYAGALARANVRLLERRTALRDALNHYLHRFVRIETRPGSSAYWISGGPQWNAAHLARAAANIGVLIEPISAPGETAQFCMGVTSIRTERIRAGRAGAGAHRARRSAARLAHLARRKRRAARRTPRCSARSAGATLLYNTVYGEPCTLRLGSDGTLSGRAGYSNEDRDSGRWWVAGRSLVSPVAALGLRRERRLHHGHRGRTGALVQRRRPVDRHGRHRAPARNAPRDRARERESRCPGSLRLRTGIPAGRARRGAHRTGLRDADVGPASRNRSISRRIRRMRSPRRRRSGFPAC